MDGFGLCRLGYGDGPGGRSKSLFGDTLRLGLLRGFLFRRQARRHRLAGEFIHLAAPLTLPQQFVFHILAPFCRLVRGNFGVGPDTRQSRRICLGANALLGKFQGMTLRRVARIDLLLQGLFCLQALLRSCCCALLVGNAFQRRALQFPLKVDAPAQRRMRFLLQIYARLGALFRGGFLACGGFHDLGQFTIGTRPVFGCLAQLLFPAQQCFRFFAGSGFGRQSLQTFQHRGFFQACAQARRFDGLSGGLRARFAFFACGCQFAFTLLNQRQHFNAQSLLLFGQGPAAAGCLRFIADLGLRGAACVLLSLKARNGELGGFRLGLSAQPGLVEAFGLGIAAGLGIGQRALLHGQTFARQSFGPRFSRHALLRHAQGLLLGPRPGLRNGACARLHHGARLQRHRGPTLRLHPGHGVLDRGQCGRLAIPRGVVCVIGEGNWKCTHANLLDGVGSFALFRWHRET